MTHRTWLSSIVLAVVIVASMVVGGVLAVNIADDDNDGGAAVATSPSPVAADSTTRPTVASDTPAAATSEAAGINAALADLPGLVEQVSPSVVQIRARGQNGGGVGSGVVVDLSGHILTNNHVVDGAVTLVVELPDGTTAAAELLGSDAGNDLAVIRADLPASALVPASFGDSDAVRVGEPVFAIGNPFDLDFTVTAGIISGIDRESQQRLNGRSIRGVLQTDAAVNPGNSGGPLFNAAGEVIGINTAVENPVGQNFFVGVGYAVPSNTALRFIPDMIAGADITHPQLGIQGVALNALSAEDAGVEVERGVYVTSIVGGSAADRAGLAAATSPDGQGELARGGDVITAIDGVEILTVQQLARIIDDHDVGDEVRLTVVRDGDVIELTAELRTWPG
jgi:putative serine protease PepD